MTYDVDSDTLIGFGKLKGKPHRELLKTINEQYADWIIKQGSEFKYNTTRDYIIKNKSDGEHIEIEDCIQKMVLYISNNRFKKNKEMTENLMGLTNILQSKFNL